MNFSERLKSYIDLIDESIKQYLPHGVDLADDLTEAVRYAMTAGGKRIRPVLVLEFCRVCGGDVKKALPFAVAAELIHNYSLVHDDLPSLDNDDFRRGNPTVHKKFGEAVAILSGDEMLNLAYEIIFENPTEFSDETVVRAGKILSKSAGINGILGGQIADITSEGRVIDSDELILIHKKKTGELISACAMLGCIAAHADESHVRAAYDFGENLGLAFQIVDDILDVTASEKVLGKPVGSDMGLDKNTYIKFFGLDKSRDLALKHTDLALSSLDAFQDSGFLKELTKKLLEREF